MQTQGNGEISPADYDDEEEPLSPLQIQLLKASKERSERVEMNQPRARSAPAHQDDEEEPQEMLSPLQKELLKASKERSERMEMNKPRLTKSKTVDYANNTEESNISNNPLAKALSQRIQSFNIAKVDETEDDDFESSPGPSPVQSPKPVSNEMRSELKPPKTKLPPPTVRPKPSKMSTKPEADVRSGSA